MDIKANGGIKEKQADVSAAALASEDFIQYSELGLFFHCV